MKDKVRVGIIGCGGIANAKHLPALSKIANVEIVGFCDLIEERAAKAAKEYGSKDAKVYKDYRKLLEDKTIDVIHVCTPNKSHSEISVASMESGKHVMCEKPMAKDSKGAEKMVETAKMTGMKLTIGYQNRFRTDSLHLKEICRRGDLGKIYYAKAHAIRRRAVPTWGVFLNEDEQGGGPLIDIGTHALDLTLWMMNNYEPKSVVGTTYHELSKKKNAANAWGPWDPAKFTVEDSAFGFIVMKDGSTIVLESSWALNSLDVGEAQTVLCGTEGGADMQDGLRINGEEFGRLFVKNVEVNLKGVDFYSGEKLEPQDVEARQWIDAIANDKDPLVKPQEAFTVTRILEGIYESAKTGKQFNF
ncbi:Gfo/Idh/MocA family protein [Athalassotoga sp.]|uniref:Gfo/Idh/MocA family protein n=1 Tax=Athalassotoga sp. TaxID=2022597 RepID=UPI003CFFC7D9